jgi:heme oxygenase (biliverdin-IX-beta and delta-forming)
MSKQRRRAFGMDSAEGKKDAGFSRDTSTDGQARSMVRAALKGALATVHKVSGHPYASLVLTASDQDGTPIFLISGLAVHTQNLEADARASLLIDATGTATDTMEGARVTLIGKAQPTDSPTARARFLARHPAAEGYADFPDFAFYALSIESAHFIGGFGKIVDLPAGDLLISLEGVEDLMAAEPGIVAHMNSDHADAVKLYATKLLGAEPGAWRMTGIDPDGCDLVLGSRGLRLPFETRITDATAARKELVRLVGVARESGG